MFRRSKNNQKNVYVSCFFHLHGNTLPVSFSVGWEYDGT